MVFLMEVSQILEKTDDCGERPAGAETYIYDLDENLYGKKIEVHFLDFMRPEMKFSGVDELKMQVLKDKETGRKCTERNDESSASCIF
mgnify:CR=1 FL=1